MSELERRKREEEDLGERHALAMGRIEGILSEGVSVAEPYRDYFLRAARLLSILDKVASCREERRIESLPLEELVRLNDALYGELLEGRYEESYADPDFCAGKLGLGAGQALCALYAQIRDTIPHAFDGRLFDRVISTELFLEILTLFEEGERDLGKGARDAICHHKEDYGEERERRAVGRMVDPASHELEARIVTEGDLGDPRYLYAYGQYVGENERRTAEYLGRQAEEDVEAMARTYTEGFRIGYEKMQQDLSKKSSVQIRYPIGFERIARAAARQFGEMGLTPVFIVSPTPPSRQYEYDHRFDMALFFDRTFADRKAAGRRKGFEERKELAAGYAGPAVIEIFGERPFAPRSKETSLRLSERQQKLRVENEGELALITNEYIHSEERSFTIIAYPIPEIGKDYEAIFRDTVKVNTLDMDFYQEAQERMIAVLDEGEYVTVKGRAGNRTDLKVALWSLADPERETLFENCLADVNIPVGEVFTSPRLTGTEGTLHVTEAYLAGLRYVDLELTFRDGMIASCSCANFESEEENRKYLRENLLKQHDTLPIGEFAIGTNTTAYVMGKKYGISDRLPILIAEKTGPHFAVGDTCYHMSEDADTFNPDGKRIVAKENEVSALRKTEVEKAYFNCHTDITIPYSELGSIVVHKANGEEVALLSGGRFVLPGTEGLNVPLDEFEGQENG